MNSIERAREISDYIVEIRRRLHRCPECGRTLPKTTGIITKELEKMNIPYKVMNGYDGICAEIKRGSGKTVVYRADTDGLPIIEQTGLPYASENGCMHACGHDCHAAMLLGLAKLFSSDSEFDGENMHGTIRLLFQPAEESTGAARLMCEDGVMDGADVFFSMHTGNMVNIPSGCFAISKGAVMAARDSFHITVYGKGCHGATPAQGIDPIVISAQIITALQTLVSREINGNENAVLTIASINAGSAYNVIPDKCEMTGSIRTLDNNVRKLFIRRLEEISGGIATVMGGYAEVSWDEGMPETFCDEKIAKIAADTAKELFSAEKVYQMEKPLMSSEDVGFFMQKAPGCYWFFSTNPEDYPVYPNHNPRFRVDDSLLYKGAALFYEVGRRYLLTK